MTESRKPLLYLTTKDILPRYRDISSDGLTLSHLAVSTHDIEMAHVITIRHDGITRPLKNRYATWDLAAEARSDET